MPNEIRFLCAGGFRAAMERIAPLFEAQHDAVISSTYATPARTRAWLEDGFPFDAGVVVAGVLRKAQSEGVEQSLTNFRLALCPVGLGVPAAREAPDISTLEAFRRALPTLGRVGLSDPKAGTQLGAETLAHAQRLGFGEEMRARVVFVDGPGSVVSAAVARGEADAVITLASEIAPIHGMRYAGPLPPEMQTEYGMQALTHASASGVAKLLLEFLKGDEAREIMRVAGLEPAA